MITKQSSYEAPDTRVLTVQSAEVFAASPEQLSASDLESMDVIFEAIW